jgi:hypothetical protein
MNMTVGQLDNTGQATTLTAGPGTADPAAVDSFNAAMGTSPAGGNAVNQATDKQIAALPQADVQRLREKWGDDEAHFREEAYELWLSQTYQDMIMRQILDDSFRRTRELQRVIEGRE